MTSFRTCPIGEGKCRMEFDYYFSHEGGAEKFEEYFGFVRQVALEDFGTSYNTTCF